MNRQNLSAAFLLSLGVAGCAPPPAPAPGPVPSGSTVMWINHFDLLPGDPTVTTSHFSLTSGVGGFTGLDIRSSTTGQIGQGGGNKLVETGLQVPPSYRIRGVRVCYQLSNARSFISQISLSQLQIPPATALSVLDDGTDLTNPGPICVNSAASNVDPSVGEVLLSLRVNYGSTSDVIVVRALGLLLEPM